jgi:Tol biopolymer transport system component
MMKRVFFYSVLFSLIAGCTTTKTIVDYISISVPEEGGIKFVQYTKDEDKVLTPNIKVITSQTGKKYIEWWAAPLISVSNDGNLLGYLAYQNNAANVFIKKTEGGTATIQRTFRSSVNDMTFSPDGKYIAFSDVTDGNSNIYLLNATEGAAIQQITSTSASEVGPCFSSDGKLIFFTKYETSMLSNGSYKTRFYIWSFNRETSLLTQYSEGFTPTLVPDGKSVVITRNNKETNNGEIWMIDLDKGTETLLLSDKDRGYSSPQVSPDGKRIVCVGITKQTSVRPTNLDIYTFNIDGTNLTQLTFHGGHDLSPKWSPDGSSIYFMSQRGSEKGSYNVWKMNYKQN